MEKSETETRVRAIVGRIGKLAEGFSGSADLYSGLGIRSASVLDLLLTLEEEFGVSISDEAFGNARSLDALVKLIEASK